MKVLQVIDTLSLGGAEKITVLLSNLLKEEGLDVAMLLLVKSGVLRDSLDKQITCHCLNRASRFDIKSLKKTAQIIKQYDIIHVHLKHNYRYVALVNKLFRLDKKIILHNHSHTLQTTSTSKIAIKHKLLQWFFKPKYYISVNNENIAWAVKDLKVSHNNAFVLENTVARIENVLVPVQKNGIVVVSNISPIKNLAFAITFAKAVQKPLTIFGRIANPAYFDELMQHIEKEDMASQVTFVHDCVEVQPFLNSFEFAIHTSFKETGPLVLVEFLAQGIPFISRDAGEVYENLTETLPYSFVSNFEIENWKIALNEILKNTPKQLQNIYAHHYSTENYLAKCLKIYQQIANS